MRKGSAILLSLVMAVIVSAVLLANPQIMNKEVDGKKVHFATKDGKKVNACIYCHVNAKIEKKKQGLMKGQPNFKTLSSRPLCSGKGCHI
jgi:hypothetical protein